LELCEDEHGESVLTSSPYCCRFKYT